MKTLNKETFEPVKYPNPRFQFFWAKYAVHKYATSHVNELLYKKFSLYGFIGASDQFVSRKNGWVPPDDPMYTYALLFDREWSDPITVMNTDFIPSITNSSINRSVSALSNFFEIIVKLYAFNEEDEEFYQIANGIMVTNLSKPGEVDTCVDHTFTGDDGCMLISYIVLTDAVDAALEITFKDPDSLVSGKQVHVQILAYYGDDFDYGYSPYTNGHYCISLFQKKSVILSEDTKLALENLVLAVPAKGSLVIDAYILDLTSGDVILNKILKLSAQLEGSSKCCIEGEVRCSFELNVNWKYKSAADTT